MLSQKQLREELIKYISPDADKELRFALQLFHCEALCDYSASELRDYLSNLFWGGTKSVQSQPILEVIDELVNEYDGDDYDGEMFEDFEQWKKSWLNPGRDFVPEDQE
jgi:hypothetical protein